VLRRNDWRLAIIYVCTIGLILVVSGFNFFSFRGISSNANRITEQTYPLVDTVNRLHIAVVNEEASLQGFLLTGDVAYLERKGQSNQDVRTSKDILLDKGKENSEYMSQIQSTISSLEQVERLFDRITSLIQQKSNAEALTELTAGNPTIDTFLDQIISFGASLNASIDNDWSDQRSQANRSMGMIVIMAVIRITVIIAAIILFRITRNALRSTFESERRYRRLVDNSPDAIAVHQNGIIVFANPACAPLMGVMDSDELIGMPMMGFVHHPYTEAVTERASKAMNEKEVGKLEEQFVRLDGSLVDVEVTAIGLSYAGRPAVLVVAREIGSRKEAERKMVEANALLQRLSILDGLTGIPNRRSFDQDRLELWNKAKMNKEAISLLMFDLDNFKSYNDYYGHLAGDACLQMIASLAEEEARKLGGMAYRYGGEEFAVLLPGYPREMAFLKAESFRSTVAGCQIPHEGIGPGARVTISVGVATSTFAQKQSMVQWLQAADDALYEAKKNGRDTTKEAIPLL
jgi:diguanylate cyclase (GGDEF)-like protein/PAS domain S-box-containing protein